MKTMIAAAAALALCACATGVKRSAQHVRDADERMVAACEFVGEVHGTSGWGGLAASTGVNSSRNQARNQAGKMGATHILWTQAQGGHAPSALGRAYRC